MFKCSKQSYVCISPIYVSNSSISSMKKQATKMKSKLALIFTWIVVIVGQTNSVKCLAIDQNSPAIQNIKPVVEAAGQPATVVIPSQAKSADTEQVRQDYRRPIWALAHMVNSIKELDYRLGKGANAVEVDVTFGKDGDPLYTYHGPPCDCWRHCHQQEDFNEYLNYVRQIAIDEPHGIGRNLSILFLDLKLDPLDQKGKARAGIQLAKSITGNLFLDSAASHATILNNATLPDGIKSAQVNMPKATVKLPPLRLILSVNHVTDIELVQNFLHYLEMNNSTHLMQRIGFDVGMNDDLQQIESMWRRFGTALHLWQGDGFTNCFSPFYNLERLSRALGKRDAPSGYPAKVYHWTIDLHDRMRESLLLGVDAIMTNHPERVLTVLQEPEYAHDFRLADRHDEPFKKLTRKLVSRSGESARYQRSANAATGGFLGNLYDVVNSWVIYLREIPFLSYPTTTRLFSGSNNRKGQPSAAQASISVVKMSGQPEYLLDAQNQTSKQLARGSMFSSLAGQQDNLSSLAQTDKKQTASNETASYEGPKWYTVLTSNMLVSMMKVLLPVP